MTYRSIIWLFLLVLGAACELTKEEGRPEMEDPEPPAVFLRGADLSYVNEMEDCGARYFRRDGQEADPYALFADAGADIVRLRLWHTPSWTAYSNLEDVKRSIARAKAQGMQVLLDFHYSDDWADPGNQIVPAAWLQVVDNTTVLGDSLYQYTYRTLVNLNAAGLLPDMVQVGNEINDEILQDPDGSYGPINWARNAALINRGLAAVRAASADLGREIQTMLHIAQPENALWWFEEAARAGIADYDWIGISYYPIWSDYSLSRLSSAIETLTGAYQKRLMVVETAYPFALDNADAANNILGNDAVAPGYPATEQGQFDFLKALEESVITGGGEGMIYWEPAWVSTGCSTRWGTGSHWDNATLFDRNHRELKGMEFYGGN